MRALNKAIKIISYIGIHLFVIIQSYFLSILCTGSLMSIVMAVASIFDIGHNFTELPYWAVLLLLSVPLGVLFTAIIELGLFSRYVDSKLKEEDDIEEDEE